ncbi:MAG TPA: V-type ATP synthase subunit D [Kiritimatiellia bacterium]|nr:V-type ATP synthase subunit D [Kiritimatiellia bacterium]HRU70441.1 V-type ATP synthase subunit D [Kiritimatiellia bacterium]
MAKIKLTKTELKAQTDALKRFQRFLPMLQLKKQQLQAEIATVDAHIARVKQRERDAKAALSSWVALFAADTTPLQSLLTFQGVRTSTSNIAGVTIPVYKGIDVSVGEMDLFATPVWHDDAAHAIKRAWALKAERALLEEQRKLIMEELNTTSQRVNLFEKVKIPECRENIRLIKIAIGDEQTASVTRGKIAKGRTGKPQEEDAA